MIKTSFTYLIVIIVLALIALSNPGQKLENKYGLPILYKLRNYFSPPSVPKNVFIVTPYKTRKPGQPDALRDWNRNIHAQVIDALTELEVASIAIDMFFRDPHEGEDEAFAKAISANERVILNQSAKPVEHLKNTTRENILRNPVEKLTFAKTNMAPSLALSEQARIDAFYSFYPILYNINNNECFGYPNDADLSSETLESFGDEISRAYVPTLLVAALEQYLLSTGKINNYIDSVLSRNQENKKLRHCDAIFKARKSIANDPELLKQLYIDVHKDRAISSWFYLIRQLSVASLQSNKIPRIRLNFYGPPQTIQTLDYQEFIERFFQISDGLSMNIFKDSIVFIGGSFSEPADQKEDGFNTVFAKGELPMSGVEVAATALANMVQHNYLIRHHRLDAMTNTALISLAIFLISIFTRNFSFIILSLIGMAGYVFYSVSQFHTLYYWPPILLPLFSFVACVLYVLFKRFYRTTQDNLELEDHLELYLSKTVASQIKRKKNHELQQAICMVTDVAGFTTISEDLDPEELHELNQEYFQTLFDCVNQMGADVIKTYGDSMTAVWKVNNEHTYQYAVSAGLNILGAVKSFNEQHPITPFKTRIGMSVGPIVIGNVGGKAQRTIELTGDTVYTASRLEQLNKTKNTSFLATKELLLKTEDITYIPVGKENLRGKKIRVEVVEVMS